jgi:predicted N-acetyltransferase YhbS
MVGTLLRQVCLTEGFIVAAVRLTPITVGVSAGVLLLGPLAVDPAFANQGHGRALVHDALKGARTGGVDLIVPIGDASYYAELGFARVPLGQMSLPGPVDPSRLLAAELKPGALAAYRGIIAADRGAGTSAP